MSYDPSKQHYPSKLTTGMGRPADPEWVGNFEEILRWKMPRRASLKMRLLPGVSYVAANMWEQITGQTYDGEAGNELAAEEIRQTIAQFCSRGIIDAKAARTNATVNVGRSFRFRRKNFAARIELELGDSPSDKYPSGYLIEGEKLAVTKELGLPYFGHAAGAEPSHLLTLGLVICDAPLPTSLGGEVRQHLDSQVELGKLDVVKIQQ